MLERQHTHTHTRSIDPNSNNGATFQCLACGVAFSPHAQAEFASIVTNGPCMNSGFYLGEVLRAMFNAMPSEQQQAVLRGLLDEPAPVESGARG